MFNELYAHPVVIFDFETYIKCNDSCMGKAKYIHLICINEKDELFITKKFLPKVWECATVELQNIGQK